MKTFSKFINELRTKQHSVAFDIMKDGENMFSTNAGNGADQVDKKLKQNKFKNILKDLTIIRTSDVEQKM